MSLEIIEENKDASDVTKRAILKEIIWWRTFICTMKIKQMKMLI